MNNSSLDLSVRQTLGGVTDHIREGNTVTFICGQQALQIHFLDDAIFRVRVAVDGDFAPIFSYALDPERSWDGPDDLSVDDHSEQYVLKTSTLHVQVQKNPCRLAVFTSEGRLLQKDLDGVHWNEEATDGRRVGCTKKLQPREMLLGLGEKSVRVDRRGHAFEHWNSDRPSYTRGEDPLYKTFPVLLHLKDDLAYGLFFDNSYHTRFDLGAADPETLHYEAADGSLCYYFYYGETPLDVVRQYSRLTGTLAMLPKWALGFHQCRHSYHPEEEVRRIAGKLRRREIPCDAIYLDIYYMDGFRIFTWDPEEFPTPRRMIEDLREDGFRTVTILDPGVKAEESYSTARSGLQRGVFCTYPDGEPFTGHVWPGPCYFPDFTRPDVRDWWGDLLEHYTKDAVAGIWCDMNEPSVFAAPRESKRARQMSSEEFHTTIDPEVEHGLEGHTADHRRVHNVYGLQMLRATYEGLKRQRPGNRPFTITRAAYSGAQRYGTAWTGDNSSTWDHLKLTIEQCTSLNVSGMPFVGSDVGGFLGHAEGRLMARWVQLGAFIPFFRNHSAIEVPRQEVWRFGKKVEDICRRYIELRYRLLPYFYSLMRRSAADGTPMIRPLLLMHPMDPTVQNEELYGFYAGDNLLVYPVVEPNREYRSVYLPEGRWYDFWTGQSFEGPRKFPVYAPLDHLPLFVRAGAILPMQPVVQYTGERPIQTLTLRIYPTDGDFSDTLYEDAGDGWEFDDGKHFTCRFSGTRTDDQLRVASTVSGNYAPSWNQWNVVVHDMPERLETTESDGQPIPFTRKEATVQATIPVGGDITVTW